MTTNYIKFTVRDKDANIVRYGVCTKESFKAQAIHDGEVVIEGNPPEKETSCDVLGDGYLGKRLRAYPPMSEQLDTIFHKGIDVWKAQIQAVKDKYPKV